MLSKDIPDHAVFKAGKIPWRILIPRYQEILDNEDKRVKNIKKMAEVSLSMSKLPPRMEDHKLVVQEKKSKYKAKADEDFKAVHTFAPSPAREVPDFKRLHKEFTVSLNRNKSAIKVTEPKPFVFHEPKQRVDLRRHMDAEN